MISTRASLPWLAALALGCAATQPRATGVELGEEAWPPGESRPASQARPVPAKKEEAPVAKQSRPTPSSTGTIPRVELNRVLDASPGRFLSNIQTEPRFVSGRFHGWRLASFFPGDARFAGVDLRAGDVVLSVNGKSVEQPEQLMEVWESLRFERTLVVAVERDGQARELRFDIRD
jgi:type II secretory pathway component PulC